MKAASLSFMASANSSNSGADSSTWLERGPSLCFRRRKIASNLQRSLVRGLALQASLALRWPRAVEFSPPACLRPPAQFCAQGRSSHRIARFEAMFHVGLCWLQLCSACHSQQRIRRTHSTLPTVASSPHRSAPGREQIANCFPFARRPFAHSFAHNIQLQLPCASNWAWETDHTFLLDLAIAERCQHQDRTLGNILP